jgi:ABC-type multidrug transport system fused ATPase/permease subunit
MYFIGKMQNQRLKFMMVQFQGQGVTAPASPNMKAELAIIILAMTLFTFLVINPVFAENQVSNWFYTSIKDIESTPIFGFIFGIVGFFFSLSIIFRMVNSISMILSGKAFEKPSNQQSEEQSDKFDDFEEIN